MLSTDIKWSRESESAELGLQSLIAAWLLFRLWRSMMKKGYHLPWIL